MVVRGSSHCPRRSCRAQRCGNMRAVSTLARIFRAPSRGGGGGEHDVLACPMELSGLSKKQAPRGHSALSKATSHRSEFPVGRVVPVDPSADVHTPDRRCLGTGSSAPSSPRPSAPPSRGPPLPVASRCSTVALHHQRLSSARTRGRTGLGELLVGGEASQPVELQHQTAPTSGGAEPRFPSSWAMRRFCRKQPAESQIRTIGPPS